MPYSKEYQQHAKDLQIKSQYSRILLNKLVTEKDPVKAKKIEEQLKELLEELEAEVIVVKEEKAVEEL